MDKRWEFVDTFLEKQTERGLRRFLRPLSSFESGTRVNYQGRSLLNLASNDYLGLKMDPRLVKAAGAAARKWGMGSGASRLVSGTTELHERVEQKLARFHSTESALTFSSGYAAGVGVIQALAGRPDRIYIDRHCHACLYDGARASGARIERFRHNDQGHLESLLAKHSTHQGKALVVADTVFSMDGDRAPLKDIARICHKHGALFLADEAHAVGVLGPHGRGLAAELGLGENDVLVMGTLSKAFGVAGAYIAGPEKVRDYLINTCRSFIYSTAPPPPLLGAIEKSLEIIETADEQRKRLLAMAERLRAFLKRRGIETLQSSTQIVPAVVGKVERAADLSESLLRQGIFSPPIRPPTVPRGTGRVRFSLTAALSEDDFEFLLQALEKALQNF